MKKLPVRLPDPVVALLVSFAVFLPSAAGVWAHGADWEVRMVGKRVGSYDVTVRTSPKQPHTGPLHVEVQLIDPKTLAYVERATVSAAARLRGGTMALAGPVPSRYVRPWHEMDMMLNKSGSWDVQLAIDGPRERGNVSFRVDILPEDKK